ncbi:MAG: hypothetical protein A2687_02455 [Candidatus Levybacteria bacterium RIFCSPHIGHO2_01_FULL_38_26]|nr:MAG: hypothetical protein A2687_02455 [Candidatus Levybacteria bacterium RIFCSPHIGHO2_01_FULL_38_26]
MSGHSKWATIKRQKGAADIKRGQVFTKLANAIIIAVRQGGGVSEPESNFKLRLAIEKARDANMPKENIERAISKAKGEDAKGLQEVVYEGFAKGGVSVIVEAATDNAQRTTSEVKNIFKTFGASFGQPGAVAYQFVTKGVIVIMKNGKKYDEIFNIAAGSGAEDIEEAGENVFIYSELSQLSKTRDRLKEMGFEIAATEVIRKPISTVAVQTEEVRLKTEDFLNKLEELDDVQKVYSNLDKKNSSY